MLNRYHNLCQDYGRRADQLNMKEKELRAKEAELRKLEQDLRSTGGLKPEKNWPPCCAFTHHDIAGEVNGCCLAPNNPRMKFSCNPYLSTFRGNSWLVWDV